MREHPHLQMRQLTQLATPTLSHHNSFSKGGGGGDGNAVEVVHHPS